MSRRIIKGGVDTSEQAYVAPILFPEWRQYAHNERALVRYLKDELVLMANSNTLSVTDIHNQSAKIQMYAGMIILGQEFDYVSRDQRTDPSGIPIELQRYRVKLRSLNGKPIRWKLGMAPADEMISGQTRPHSALSSYPKMVDVVIDEGELEIETSLTDAWRILHQQGQYCRVAGRAELRKKYWRVAEVRPEPVKKLAGRPRREAA